MVKRRNLRPDPRRAMADLLAKQAAQTKALGTVPTGVKDLGETGDAVWTDPDSGTESSVRELPALIDETAVAIEAAKKELEDTREDLGGAKDDLEAERIAREQALAAAAAALAELDEKLEAGPSTADLDAIRTDLAAAAEVAASATTAATEANTAALAASQAALEAAGIAASKGRVIVSETEPTGADRTPSNIWIKPIPDDPSTEVEEKAVTYVYLEASDEWQATTSSELAQAAQNALDAREAAQQAQQRADTAMSNAATAQASAEAAQRTANQATLDAAGAHNAAVAAQAAADAAAKNAVNVVTNPSFENGLVDWTASAVLDSSRAHSGASSVRATSGQSITHSRLIDVQPGQVWEASAWFWYEGTSTTAIGGLRLQSSTDGTTWANTDNASNLDSTLKSAWQQVRREYTVPAGVKYLRARAAFSTMNGSAWVDDFVLSDITAVKAAQAAASAALATANAAADAAAGIRADLASGPSLFEDPGFERGKGGVPFLSAGKIERSQEWAASGSWSMKYTAPGTGGNNFGSYGYGTLTPGRWYAVRATVHAGDAKQQWRTVWDARTAPTAAGTLIAYVVNDASAIIVEAGETKTMTWFFQAPEGAYGYRYWCGQAAAYNAAANTGQTVYVDDFRLVDVTDSYPQYLEAKAIADSKATPQQVTAAATQAENAAKAAAAADAKAKADQAKADALAGAATDAKSKADAAQAAAVAAASADAKTKADKALADALDALAKARGEISDEITTSANGKNAITVSSSAPSASTPGVVAGDTWWRVDSAGTIFGQWTWTGTAWVPATIRSEVIANLDVSKLVVTGDARFTEAVAERLFADVFAAHKITANELNIAAVGPDGELVEDSVRGVHIGDGQVSANKLLIVGNPEDPDEVGLVARIAAIMHLAVEHLVVTDGATIDAAVILKLASEMVTAGVIRTAETGQRVVIDQGGVVLIGLDDDGFEYELVRLGPSGENLLTIGKTTVAPDGIATPSLEAGEVAVNGRTVADMISDAAQGTIAWAYATNSTAWDGSATEMRRMQVSATLLPNRRYSIVMDHRWARVRGTGTVRLVERLRYSTVGDSQATTAWGQLAVMGTILASTSQSQTVPQIVGILDTADLGITQATTVWFRWTTQGPGSKDYRIEGASGETIRLTLRDEGPSVSSSGMSWFSTGSAVEGATEAPPEVVEKVTRTEKFAATRAESWNRGASSFLSGKSGTVYQGKYPSVSAREGAWWFPALTGNLSGAKIKRVQLRFYIDHTYWGAGGTADIRLHGKTGFTTGGLDTSIRTLKVKREAQYSIDVPASYLDGFRTGTWRGFGLSTSSTNLEYYVQATLANAEIWITYEK